MYLAVSGNMGSGKTTLARLLAREIGLRYVPQDSRGVSYLRDLFTAPLRWGFEAETAFLVSKALEILNGCESGDRMVVDRTLEEDIQIFARLLHDRGQMDDRAYATYQQVAALVLGVVKAPSLVIYCDCSVSVCARRVESRSPRNFDVSYPEGHMEDVGARYQDWLSRFNRCPVVVLRTDRIDTRQPGVARRVCEEVERVLGREMQAGVPERSHGDPGLGDNSRAEPGYLIAYRHSHLSR